MCAKIKFNYIVSFWTVLKVIFAANNRAIMIGILFSILAVGGAEGTAGLSLIILLETASILFLILGVYKMKDTGDLA